MIMADNIEPSGEIAQELIHLKELVAEIENALDDHGAAIVNAMREEGPDSDGVNPTNSRHSEFGLTLQAVNHQLDRALTRIRSLTARLEL